VRPLTHCRQVDASVSARVRQFSVGVNTKGLQIVSPPLSRQTENRGFRVFEEESDEEVESHGGPDLGDPGVGRGTRSLPSSPSRRRCAV
jgi:hypothetical protein